MTQLHFAKGHGTGNDFVIVPDPRNELELSADVVRALCDRRTGIGGDGLLHVVQDQDGTWFMDYRNADGSLAEMCGNGVRVFAHWLVAEEGVGASTFAVRTRAGKRAVTIHRANHHAAEVSVNMGQVSVTGVATAHMGSLRFAGLGVDVGNPHLAAVIPGLSAAELSRIEMSPPSYDEELFPAGANVEVVTPLVDGAVHMRVYERGVGETNSCGTGTVAAAYAALADAGLGEGTVRVYVPGGSVAVEIAAEATLTGPSRIVARGVVDTGAL